MGKRITMRERKMKYTKKQIAEAIAYWKKQLENCNYKKVNESDDAASLDEYTEVCYKDIRGGKIINMSSLQKIKDIEQAQLR